LNHLHSDRWKCVDGALVKKRRRVADHYWTLLQVDHQNLHGKIKTSKRKFIGNVKS